MNRLRIVQRLARGEASVTELMDHVGLSQPLVSWHVGKLRDAGVVSTTRIGREQAALGLDRSHTAPHGPATPDRAAS